MFGCLWRLLLLLSCLWFPQVSCQLNTFSPFSFDVLVAPVEGFFKLNDPLVPLVAVSALGLTKAVLLRRMMAIPRPISSAEFNGLKGGTKLLSGAIQNQLSGYSWRKGLRSLWSARRRSNKGLEDLEALPRILRIA